MAAHQRVNAHSRLETFLFDFLLPVRLRLAQQQGEQQRAHQEKEGLDGERLDGFCFHRFLGLNG